MMRRLLLLALPLAVLAAAPRVEERPNILLIFADDIGYEKLGCYGGQDVPTPNLDRLAASGVRFTRLYTSAVCTPSRMTCYTGTYVPRHGYTQVLPVHLGTKKKVDFEKTLTYAQLLRDAGYATSVTGKWQLATLEFHPDHCRSAGFDSWCVWQIWREGAKTTRYWNPVLNHDGKVRDDIADRYGPDVLTDYVIERMRSAKTAGKPFMIHHNMMLPHWPIHQTPDDRKAGRKGSLDTMIRYLDGQVGRLLDAVDALGIAGDTYVFFIGDNGTDSKLARRTDAGEVRGGKNHLDDAGIHVPLLVSRPGRVPKGHVADALVDMADVFPTFCELAGVKIPDGAVLDGRSFAPFIHGREGTPRPWVTAGLRDDFLVFDGKWRLHHKGGKLFDCRKLPVERPADEADPEARAARARLTPAIERLAAMRSR